MALPRRFYNRPTLTVAADLLGKVLVHVRRGVRTSGIIVEVEAYIGESDPACHAAPGPTRRNAPLYGPAGYAYVYLNYGIHHLVNVVTEAEGAPAAILIRALDPLEGIETMRRRRARALRGLKGMTGRRRNDVVGLPVAALCRGPGNVTMAMGISLAENTVDLTGDRLFIEDRSRSRAAAAMIQWTTRVGIRVGTERPWRAYLRGHPAVSKPPFPAGRQIRRLRGAP